MSINEEVCGKKSRGRPKQFDRDRALESALDLFWRHGYEATSLADLVEVTGAKAPTLYAEFGNKEGMFRAAVERYLQKYTTCTNQLLEQDLPVAEIVEAYVRSSVEVFTDPDTPYGVRLGRAVVRVRRRRPDAAQETSCAGSGAEGLLRSQGAAGRTAGENRHHAAGEIRDLHH